VGLLCAGAAAFSAVALAFAPTQPAANLAVAWALAAGSLAIVPLLIWRNWHKRGLAAALHDGGFAYRDRSGLRAFAWSDIDSVWHAAVRRHFNGIYVGTTHVYTVQPTCGPRVVLNSRLLTDVERLGAAIERESATLLLPIYVRAFDSGVRLRFGPFSIDSEGLHAGRRSIAWSAIRGVDVRRGYLRVLTVGRWLAWSRFAVRSIPNFAVLTALLERGGDDR
jgi:hypothetical protein